jgi:acyl-CoA thioesterase II
MFPHDGIGQAQAHISVSTGVLTQSLAFHRDVNVNDWILIDHEAMYAGGGRVYGRGHAFTQDGKLVASFVQESLVRNFPQGQNPAGKEATIF